MKRLASLLLVIGLALLVYSCSDLPPTASPTVQDESQMMAVRPNFIDQRPQAEVQAAVISPSSIFWDNLDKKPPKPPPDTGSSDDPNPNPAHKYAYIVGISDYEGNVNDLEYPDDDAQAMRSFLQGEGFTIREDLNRSATADAITAGLQWLIDQAQPGDEIAFCYSGHGGKAPTYGSSIISTDLYYVTHGYVMQYFNAVDCSKKLMTLDCCVIGDFLQDCESGTMMALASNRTDSYDVPAFQHGAWTYFWLEGIDDLNYIFAEDAANYAEDEMTAWAKPYHLRVSPTHSDKYSGMFDM